MLTLTLYRGYPGSGKSTEAKRRVEMQGGVRIERDELRKMLFNKFSGLKRKQEELVTETQYLLIERMLKYGSNVHVSDTNLNPDTIKNLVDLGVRLGVRVEIVDVETPAIECVRRNFQRRSEGKRNVPDKVIWDMARRYPLPFPQVITLDYNEETGWVSAIGH
jgi:predicted kinase